MQTWDAITSRRNVRSFADRPIAAADLDQILEAGRRAPSSQNWQPWDFILVTDRGQLRELARVWRGAGHVADSAATIVVIGPADDNAFGRAQFDLGQATMAMTLAAVDRQLEARRRPLCPHVALGRLGHAAIDELPLVDQRGDGPDDRGDRRERRDGDHGETADAAGARAGQDLPPHRLGSSALEVEVEEQAPPLPLGEARHD